jgi:DNA topoisomerase-3
MRQSSIVSTTWVHMVTCVRHGLKMEQDKKSIAKNIQQQARVSRILFIWTDCDREGEHIGSEVRKQAFMGNRRLEVKRAKFSNTERAWVKSAVL